MALPQRTSDVIVDPALAQSSRDALDKLADAMRERYGADWADLNFRGELVDDDDPPCHG